MTAGCVKALLCRIRPPSLFCITPHYTPAARYQLIRAYVHNDMKEIKLIGCAGKGERRENGRRGSRCQTALKRAENPLRFPATLADAFLEVAPCEKWRDLPYSEGKNIDLTDYGSEGYRFDSCQVRHFPPTICADIGAFFVSP